MCDDVYAHRMGNDGWDWGPDELKYAAYETALKKLEG